MRKKAIFPLISGVVLIFFVFSAGCWDPTDPVKDAIAKFDRAIDEMSYANADWQAIVQRLLNELPDTVQSSIRTELSNTLNRAIATSGVEFRCDSDFVRKRVLQDLIRIRAKLKGESVNPVEPAFCQVTPNNLDLSIEMERRPTIVFDGYDFDAIPRPEVFILQKNGQEIDVSKDLSIVHHYEMVLATGVNGLGSKINAQSDKILLKWKGTVLSEVPIIQASCKVQTVTVRPSMTSWMPPHTWGDREFDGNGPQVSLDIYIKNNIDRVNADIYMRAEETESDWTMADGWTSVVLYEPPPGWKVVDVSPKSEVHHQYLDTNHANDPFPISSGPVNKLEYTGDTDSDMDAGGYTKVWISWNPFTVKIQQTENCT